MLKCAGAEIATIAPLIYTHAREKHHEKHHGRQGRRAKERACPKENHTDANFFTLKISYLRKNFNKINPYILKLNKLVISLQCKGWTTTSRLHSRAL